MTITKNSTYAYSDRRIIEIVLPYERKRCIIGSDSVVLSKSGVQKGVNL